MLKDRIVKIRWIKPYPSAHNHLAIGQIVESQSTHIVVNCRTFHFNKAFDGIPGRKVSESFSGGVKSGATELRAIPWTRIEVINILDDALDWNVPAIIDSKSNLILDNKQQTLIAKSFDS